MKFGPVATNLLGLVAPEGYKYMIIVPGYWGKGNTLREAVTNVAREGGESAIASSMLVYLVDPSARLNEMGDGVEYKTGGAKSIHIGTFKLERVQR